MTDTVTDAPAPTEHKSNHHDGNHDSHHSKPTGQPPQEVSQAPTVEKALTAETPSDGHKDALATSANAHGHHQHHTQEPTPQVQAVSQAPTDPVQHTHTHGHTNPSPAPVPQAVTETTPEKPQSIEHNNASSTNHGHQSNSAKINLEEAPTTTSEPEQHHHGHRQNAPHGDRPQSPVSNPPTVSNPENELEREQQRHVPSDNRPHAVPSPLVPVTGAVPPQGKAPYSPSYVPSPCAYLPPSYIPPQTQSAAATPKSDADLEDVMIRGVNAQLYIFKLPGEKAFDYGFRLRNINRKKSSDGRIHEYHYIVTHKDTEKKSSLFKGKYEEHTWRFDELVTREWRNRQRYVHHRPPFDIPIVKGPEEFKEVLLKRLLDYDSAENLVKEAWADVYGDSGYKFLERPNSNSQSRTYMYYLDIVDTAVEKSKVD